MPRFAPALLAALLLAGCSPVTGPGWTRVIGIVDVQISVRRALELPDTVVAGQAFTATVTTYGSSSCTRPDGAEVEVRGRIATITPYDRVAPPGSTCTGDLHAFPREVRLRFDGAGEAAVRVRSRGGEVVLERRVMVRAGAA